MSVTLETTSAPIVDGGLPPSQKVKKAILIAISTIFAIGMIFSYAFGGPWLLTAALFALILAPLFPLGKPKNDRTGRIPEPSPRIIP